MLATTLSPWSRAMRIRDRCPACRLPMVGTNATRPAFARRARSFSVLSITSMAAPSEAMLRGREAAVLHRGDIGRHGRADAVLPLHEVAHEARRCRGLDAERIVEHEHLAGALGCCADADDGNAQ